MDSSKLVLFFNNGTNAIVFYSGLPDPKAAKCEMKFTGPKTVNIPYDHKLQSARQADPVYDSQKEEIWWATHGPRPKDYVRSDEASQIDLWCIGKHFSVDSITSLGGVASKNPSAKFTGLVPASRNCAPSVVLVGSTVSAAVGTPYDVGDAVEFRFMQKPKTTWIEAAYNGGNVNGITDFKENKIFSYSGTSAPGGINYVYATSQGSSSMSWFCLDTMRAGNFLNITEDSSLRWQENKICLGFEDGEIPAHVFTHGKDAHNLIFVCLESDSDRLVTAAVPLKADGALDIDNNRSRSTQNPDAMDPKRVEVTIDKEPISEYGGSGDAPSYDKASRSICAFEYLNNLLILWHSEQGISGVVGELDVDGRVPEDWKFRTVEVDMEGLEYAPWTCDVAGVIVSNDFI